jgi:protein involved in polysaccharide export with SLBB domain
MIVHVMGEVLRPGEYRVADDTDVLELVSKAGGPTEFANMSEVSLRRRDVMGVKTASANPMAGGGESVVKVDLKDFLKHKDEQAPPILSPGDVVTVPRNKMAKWRTAAGLIRDVSVVVTAYLLYLRVEQNN